MEVKRHFNRILGSFRRKPHQKPTGIGVIEAFQNKDTHTASRWELLDFEEEECRIAQEREQSLLAEASLANQFTDLHNPSESKPTFTSNSTSPEDCVDLTRQNSNRLSQRISRSFRKLRSPKVDQCDGVSLVKPMSLLSSPIDVKESLEGPYYPKNESSNVSSVVQEINETIDLINEFKPTPAKNSMNFSHVPAHQFMPGFQMTSNPLKPPITRFPVDFENIDDSIENNAIAGMSMLQASNPDLILSLEEVSRLTSTKIWTDSVQREIINLSENEGRRTTSLFAPDDPFCTSKLGTLAPTSDSIGESSVTVRTLRATSDTPCGERSAFSSYSSRPWADEMRMHPGPTARKPNILRSSGRKLYKKIHSRLAKKGEGETAKGDDGFGWEDALCTPSSMTATTTSTFSDERNKEKEIKSIHTRSHSHEEDDGKIGNRLGLKRSRSSRLSHSFRKVISFPRRSSFTPLDGKNNNDKKRNDAAIKMSQNSYEEGDYRVLSLPTKDLVAAAQKPSEGESALVRKRSLSFRAFQTPAKGMSRILRKGASAFGRSMMYASLATPMGTTEYPIAPSKYPEAYWDDEDYFYEFRRYCQSSEMYYNERASNVPGAGIVQHA